MLFLKLKLDRATVQSLRAEQQLHIGDSQMPLYAMGSLWQKGSLTTIPFNYGLTLSIPHKVNLDTKILKAGSGVKIFLCQANGSE